MADETPEEGVYLRVEWRFPEGMATRWTNNFVVQTQGDDFVLSFFEIRPPLVLGSLEEQREQLAALSTVQAEGVARVVMSAQKMQELIQLLQGQFERYEARRAEENGNGVA